MRFFETKKIAVCVSRLASRVRRPALRSPLSTLRSPRGFTLMEVNLAIFIMAVGLLAMVALYPLAYRESRQSKDDVKAAAAADCVLNTLTAALSSRNIEWHDWVNGIEKAYDVTKRGRTLEGGWLSYCDNVKNTYAPKKRAQINAQARQVFNALADINKDHSPSWPVDDEFACALVAQWGQIPIYDGDGMRMEDDRSRVAISLRMTRRAGDLLAQPVFYTEVHFQGDQKDLKE
ncbi:MAG: prepilin-type N-terminal cleavage/methylation domain-containing protein [Kiritimatiellae bacterium]|nr:prepilin-type N-terminal cleavage/methylation domain-containing protein [Kiritimatiellia bacterium]